jgi:hypothetical protein
MTALAGLPKARAGTAVSQERCPMIRVVIADDQDLVVVFAYEAGIVRPGS